MFLNPNVPFLNTSGYGVDRPHFELLVPPGTRRLLDLPFFPVVAEVPDEYSHYSAPQDRQQDD